MSGLRPIHLEGDDIHLGLMLYRDIQEMGYEPDAVGISPAVKDEDYHQVLLDLWQNGKGRWSESVKPYLIEEGLMDGLGRIVADEAPKEDAGPGQN